MSKLWNILVVATLVATLTSPVPIYAESDLDKQSNTEPISSKDQLSCAAPMMKGHLVALYFDHYIVTMASVLDWDRTDLNGLRNEPVLVGFDEAEKCIELRIVGSQVSIDDAKSAMDMFRNTILAATIAGINERFGMTLEEGDVTITYSSSGNELLVFRNGSYVVN